MTTTTTITAIVSNVRVVTVEERGRGWQWHRMQVFVRGEWRDMYSGSSYRDDVPALPRIDRILHLSTSHIPPNAAAQLNARMTVISSEGELARGGAEPLGWLGHPYEHGWFVWVPESREDNLYVEAEPWLKAIYELAYAYGAAWIKFDADEAEFPGLPTFDWS